MIKMDVGSLSQAGLKRTLSKLSFFPENLFNSVSLQQITSGRDEENLFVLVKLGAMYFKYV
jgi:hypothetical protein